MTYYTGPIPGLFPTPDDFFTAGAAWNALTTYTALTGDTSYASTISTALDWQSSSNADFLPPNQTFDASNDQQALWALAALSAHSSNLALPASSPYNTSVSWLDHAVNVFNSQARRWDATTCAGGLHWQIFAFNAGYNYKDSASNGLFFQLAAELALVTRNQTYADWATKAWDWGVAVGLVDAQSAAVYDGTSTDTNCTMLDHIEWTFHAGAYLAGAAALYNYVSFFQSFRVASLFQPLSMTPAGTNHYYPQTATTSPAATVLLWRTRTTNLTSSTAKFFPNSILSEIVCEPTNCDTDQTTFKGLLAANLAQAAAYAPLTQSVVVSRLANTAQGVAAACSGGAAGTSCGTVWGTGAFDGRTGLGQEVNALQVLLAQLSVMGANGTAAVTPVSSSSSAGASLTSSTSTRVAGAASTSVASVPASGTVSSAGGSSTASAAVPVYTGAAVVVEPQAAGGAVVAVVAAMALLGAAL